MGEVKKEEKKVSRRDYLKYTGAAIGGLVVGGALGYLAKPAEVIKETVTAPGVEKTVTVTAPGIEKTVTVTKTAPITETIPTTQIITTSETIKPPELPKLTEPTTPIKLTFWKWQAIALTDERIQSIVNIWNTLHPNVKIEFTVMPELSEPEFIAKVEQATEAGTGPDIIHTSDNDAVTLAYDGYFAEAPEAIRKIVDYYVLPPFNEILYLWGPDMVKRMYAFPGFRGGAAKLGWVNEYHLEEAGLPRDWDPADWNELIDVAKKLTKYDSAGNLVRSGLFLRIAGHVGGIWDKFMPLFLSAGGRGIWYEGGKWHTDLDSQIARDVVQLYLDVLYKYKIYQPGFPGDVTALANEQISMQVPRENSEVIPVMLKVKPEKFSGPEGPKGFHAFAVPPPKKGMPSKTWLDMHMVAVNSKSPPEKQRWAFQFIGWVMSNKDVKLKIYNEIGQWAPFKDIVNDPPFNSPFYQKLTELMKTGTSRLFHPLAATIAYDGGTVLSRIFNREISPEDGLNELARVVLEDANKIVKKS